MDARPHVSILIPAYRERFFGEALRSALAQHGPSMEIVVSDDSSGGAIEAAVRACGDSRVAYSRNLPALGFEANFTHCLEHSRGDLVKFLNDDDRLRPDCVASLAAAFDANPDIVLATSRRVVIDENGAPRAGLPATSPVSHVSCTMSGRELGDFALVNGLNLVGEPTTVMFRRSAVAIEAAGIFCWNGRHYHCLADLSLWLRLLARGDAYYFSPVLSEYRVHPGQEQRGAPMGLDCITERLHLARQARAAGFLAADAQYRAALERVRALAAQWRARGRLAPGEDRMLESFAGDVELEIAAVA